jgi:molecular chaperone DnaJ
VRLDIDLSKAVFGSEEELTLDTAIGCGRCGGDGAEPGTGRQTCPICKGAGEIQQVQRSFLGQVMTSRPCVNCQGFGATLTDPCHDCSGDGRVRTRRSLTLKVPAGVDTGTRIQLTGEGEVGPGNGPRADLYVEIRVVNHDVYTRRGDDLHASVELPMAAAALGTTIKLSTFDGMQDLDIKAGTQSGDVLTLRGLGVTHLRHGGRGDLLVHATVQTPTKLTDEQQDLLRQFAALRGEERPEGRLAPANKGLFGKLRDAFKEK